MKNIRNDMKTRTIKLTHDEIERIINALQYVHDKSLDYVRQNRKILDRRIIEKILERANKYFDTINVFYGERDV